MPVSSQCLYFHLGLNADDDGVVEAFTVMNSVGASEDDLKILAVKGFVKVLNEDLVTFITDWRENNKIRSDRKIDSIYKDLLLRIMPDVQLIDAQKRTDNELRSLRYKEATLPDKFNGVIRGLFYGERCPICSAKMTDGNTKPSVQHNMPISKGGKHDIDNISVICLSCNMSTKDKETDKLNNALVKERWENYLRGLTEDSLRTDRGLAEDSIGKGSVVKDSLDQVNLGERSGVPSDSGKNCAVVCGPFNNVHITAAEYEQLKAQFPNTYNDLINNFSTKLHKHGYKYNNHYATILQWAKEDGAKQHETQSGSLEQDSSFDGDEFFKAALERSEREYKKLSKTAAEDPALLDRLKNVISG